MKTHRVVGPPGCGKTTYLTRQAPRAAEKYGAHAIAVCSLTRAAAAVIAGRDSVIPPENVGTLHAHCYRALDRPQLAEIPEGIREWNDTCGAHAWKLSRSSQATDDPLADIAMSGGEGDQLLSRLNVARARMQDPSTYPPDLAAFGARWQQFKDDTGRLDFTDCIEQAADHVEHMPGRPKVIFVDEAQDISRLEHRLLTRWSEHAEQLVVVGDPDQALYTWRGADPRAVFGQQLDDQIILSQSYRVPACAHEAAVAMIDRVPDRLPVAYQPTIQTGSVAHANVQYNDPEPLAELIQHELYGNRTVMVLTSCGYMLNPLLATLKQHGVPFCNPYRTKHGGWNPLNGARRLLAFLRPSNADYGPDARLWSWEELRLWTDPLQAAGTLVRGAKTKIAEQVRIHSNFDGDPGEAIVTVPELHELFTDDAYEQLFNLDVTWWRDALRHTEQKRMRYGIECYTRYGIAGLTAEPRLIVGTIHSVKGGEADTVIVLPDLSTAGYYDGLKTTGEAHDSVIRMMYVAFTRTRDKLILGQPSGVETITW